MVYIAELTTDIRGETNFVANTLWRPSVSAIGSASVINYKELSEDQALDAECMRLRHSTSSTFDFQLLKSFDNILCATWCDATCRRDMLDHTSWLNFRERFLELSWARTSVA